MTVLTTQIEDKTHMLDRRLSVAPMMNWTDRHCRYFHRLLAPQALLFTEMVTAEAILHAGAARFCDHDPAEAPLALQLGGSEPARLAAAIKAAVPFQFAEINLNVGCPSDRVQSGKFGACLMADPKLVADCLYAMAEASPVPVSIKCRIGIDDMDPVLGLDNFVDVIAGSGVKHIYLHARKAWLSGLSPKENRDIPPLDYERVVALAKRRPDLCIYLNGGLVEVRQVADELQRSSGEESGTVSGTISGVMIGRAAYKTPYLLAELSQLIHGVALPDRQSIAEQMAEYARKQQAQGVRLHSITRHMLGLFAGQRGARLFRRYLGEATKSAGPNLIPPNHIISDISTPNIILQAAHICAGGNHKEVA